MKYEVSITIDKDIETIANTLRDPNAALKWMNGLLSMKHIEGDFETIGSKYEMIFQNGKKKQVMIETIKSFNPPSEMTLLYEMGNVKNICENKFSDLHRQTKYTMVNIFKFPWYLQIIMPIFKKMFVKQTYEGMIDFKNFIEQMN